MTSRDFAYWLQGFFELSGAETLSLHQLRLIRAHLDMVFVHEKNPTMPRLIYWLQGQLDFLHPGTETLTKADTAKIKERVNDTFLHVIDPSFPEEEQDDLDDAHGNSHLQRHPARRDTGRIMLKC